MGKNVHSGSVIGIIFLAWPTLSATGSPVAGTKTIFESILFNLLVDTGLFGCYLDDFLLLKIGKRSMYTERSN